MGGFYRLPFCDNPCVNVFLFCISLKDYQPNNLVILSLSPEMYRTHQYISYSIVGFISKVSVNLPFFNLITIIKTDVLTYFILFYYFIYLCWLKIQNLEFIILKPHWEVFQNQRGYLMIVNWNAKRRHLQNVFSQIFKNVVQQCDSVCVYDLSKNGRIHHLKPVIVIVIPMVPNAMALIRFYQSVEVNKILRFICLTKSNLIKWNQSLALS